MKGVWAAALLAIFVCGSARAAGTPEEQAACRPDVRHFCANISGGDEKYKACLQAHFSELSQNCQHVLMKH